MNKINESYLQIAYPTIVASAKNAKTDPTAKGAVSSLYVPVALHLNVGPHIFVALYIKLCILKSLKYNFAICDVISLSPCVYIVITRSLHVYDLPTGVGNSRVECGGVVSFTFKPGLSICSNFLFDVL